MRRRVFVSRVRVDVRRAVSVCVANCCGSFCGRGGVCVLASTLAVGSCCIFMLRRAVVGLSDVAMP